jgi:hypothetical protein
MTPEELRAYHREYYHAHREEIRAYRAQRYCHDTCKILKEHKEALADDPERLSTEFILKLVQGDDA